MIIEATATGKTVEEAKEAALLSLGLNVDDIEADFEVISLPTKKVLGIFGGSPAKVRVFKEVPDNVKAEKTVKPAAKKAPAKKEVKKESAVAAATDEPKVECSKERIDTTVKYLHDVLINMGVSEVKVEPIFEKDGIKLNFDGKNLGVAIGRKGETLDALQHLVSLVANKGSDAYVRVSLNTGGYREKREDALVAIAKKSASQAQRSNRNVILEPMNSYERRIIHNVVQEIDGVMSWSIGENEHRRVCIGTSKDNKPFRESRGHRSNDRRGRNDRRPSNRVDAPVTRQPKKDTEGAALYGKIEVK